MVGIKHDHLCQLKSQDHVNRRLLIQSLAVRRVGGPLLPRRNHPRSPHQEESRCHDDRGRPRPPDPGDLEQSHLTNRLPNCGCSGVGMRTSPCGGRSSASSCILCSLNALMDGWSGPDGPAPAALPHGILPPGLHLPGNPGRRQPSKCHEPRHDIRMGASSHLPAALMACHGHTLQVSAVVPQQYASGMRSTFMVIEGDRHHQMTHNSFGKCWRNSAPFGSRRDLPEHPGRLLAGGASP